MAGHSILIRGAGISSLFEWEDDEENPLVSPMTRTNSMLPSAISHRSRDARITGWEYASLPPGQAEVQKWLKANSSNLERASRKKILNRSQASLQPSGFGLFHGFNAVSDHWADPSYTIHQVD